LAHRPIAVSVITYTPTPVACAHCRRAYGPTVLARAGSRGVSALPVDPVADFARLAEWARRMVDLHGRRIHLEVLDAGSPEGFVASVRYGVWQYPSVVVNGHAVAGTDQLTAERLLDMALAPPSQVARSRARAAGSGASIGV